MAARALPAGAHRSTPAVARRYLYVDYYVGQPTRCRSMAARPPRLANPEYFATQLDRSATTSMVLEAYGE